MDPTLSNFADFKTHHISNFNNSPSIERQLVQEFFGKTDGYYVDVGANDPIIDSQTQHLEALGWNGLLVEPDPDYCQLLRKARKGTVIEVACSSLENEGKQLQLNRAGPHSTMEDQPIILNAVVRATVMVKCETLNKILKDNNAPVGFDFFSIDIEGHELVALSGFDFSHWKPKLILIEDHVINHKKHQLMLANGYQLILRTGINSWYVPTTQDYTFSITARLEIFRKYYLGLPLRKYRYTRQH
jgi:FkbM family methyltransferase